MTMNQMHSGVPLMDYICLCTHILATQPRRRRNTRKAIQGEIRVTTASGELRTLRSSPDWSENAINGDHLWVSSTASSELCYVGEAECTKQGPRLACVACQIVAHTGCIGTLIDKIKFSCKPSFMELGGPITGASPDPTLTEHHWVHKRYEKARCRLCGKSFQSKLSFSNKEFLAISCSWCKTAYHNKETCFDMQKLTESCAMGTHADLIVPPTWIVKLPRKGSLASVVRRPSPRSNKPPTTTSRGARKRLTNTRRSELGQRSESRETPPDSVSETGSIGSGISSSGHPMCGSDPGLDSHRKSLTPSTGAADEGDDLAANLSVPNVATAHNPQRRRSSSVGMGAQRCFVIKPIPTESCKPLIVFINPKSGGNQGGKLMQKFQWLLNPRQVFDLTSSGGPRPGLDLYKRVPNLRVLACGGDGTVGWIFSALEEVGIDPPPPVAVLPLGTGNDLARSLGWGGGYTDEPISKILLSVRDGDVASLDRWDLNVERNNCNASSSSMALMTPSPTSSTVDTSTAGTCPTTCSTDLWDRDDTGGKESLPLNVFNNYFSIGVDAHIALEFHEAREAHPERFNSRLRNKMFYGQAGGKDLLQRKWKDLSSFLTLECDGQDMTSRLKELKVHSVLFLNIPSYSGGTRPWGTSSSSYEAPRMDDALIEVIGLTTYQLPLLQAGGHGTCIAQCRTARVTTTTTVPMQVDGEPCRLLPSIISLSFRNKANLVVRQKGSQKTVVSLPPPT